MREIKFRAWSLSEKRFLNNFDLRFATINTGFEHPSIQWQQSTGLKDKNGKDIYEGDVVKTDSLAVMEVIYREDLAQFVCRFKEGCSCSVEKAWQVIGNIYENSELLEKE